MPSWKIKIRKFLQHYLMTPITMVIKTLNLHTIKLILIPILLSIPNLAPKILPEFILWIIGILGGFVGTDFCDLDCFFLLGINFATLIKLLITKKSST